MKDAGMLQRQQLNKDLRVHAQKDSYIRNFQFIYLSGIFIECLPWDRHHSSCLGCISEQVNKNSRPCIPYIKCGRYKINNKH